MDYPAFICIEDFLSEDKLKEISQHLMIKDDERESHLYDRRTKAIVHDPTFRSSRKTEYRSSDLFDVIQKEIVNVLNNQTNCEFFLIRNDIEVIRYQQGDFFNRHTDHVNFESNGFVNYTFLLNLEGCQKGGETILWLPKSGDNSQPPEISQSPQISHSSQKTEEEKIFACTGQQPGSLLVFPKNMPHAGHKVLEGQKIVLMGNLIYFQSKQKEDRLIVQLTSGDHVVEGP